MTSTWNGNRKNKWNGCGMAKFKGRLPYFVKYEVCVYNNTINFNSSEIWSQFSTVFVFFFLLKNVLVPRTSYAKVLNVRTRFQPVLDNRTSIGFGTPGATHWVLCTCSSVSRTLLILTCLASYQHGLKSCQEISPFLFYGFQ